MKRILFVALLALPGCEDPSFGFGATVSGGSVSPTIVAGGSNVRVAVSP
jgi:hypothetical protein